MTTSREPSARAVEHAPDPHRLFVTVQKDRARETAFTTPERAHRPPERHKPANGTRGGDSGPAAASGAPDDR